MAEAIAAFAVAGNVLQFLQAGSRFILNAQRIFRAQGDGLSNLRDLRLISTNFQDILTQLQAAPRSSKHISTGLLSLSSECSRTIRGLLSRLEQIGAREKGHQVDRVLAAFQATWYEREIDSLKERMDSFRNQLASNLILELRLLVCQSLSQQSVIISELRSLRAQVSGLHDDKEQLDPVIPPGNVVMDILSGYLASDDRESHVQLKLLETTMRSTITNDKQLLAQSKQHIAPKLKLPESRHKEMQESFINSFLYTEIAYRELAIAIPYRETFQWIFQDSSERQNAGFVQWLESDAPLFWITGKLGSGKSTLMKYIAPTPNGSNEGGELCEHHLKKWAGRRPLVIAAFYFWAAGTSVEASKKGLLQSLLWQLLQQYPSAIPHIAPGIWESACYFNSQLAHAWAETELHKFLYGAVKHISLERGASICLFIDGFDEFQGDPTKLIETLQELLKIPNVKVCVSSRPWLVFEDAFAQAPNLRLQDLTYPDIKFFVQSRLQENEGFERLQAREPAYASSLIDQITEKSSGVFLWVHLVVKSLLAGLSYDDRISDLKRRLDLLPPDIERLYVAILEDLDPFYFGHASQYFKLVLASDDSAEALLMSFADEEEPDFAINLPIREITPNAVRMRIETLRRRLNSRCKGLLEIGPNNRAAFLHRSVRDFLDNPDIKPRVAEASKNFDTHLQLCSANLAMLKTSGSAQPLAARGLWVVRSLRAAARVVQYKPQMIRLVDALNQTIQSMETPAGAQSIYRLFPNIDHISPWTDQLYGTSFLALTTRFGVTDYVRARAAVGGLVDDDNHDREDMYRVINRTSKLQALKPRRFGSKLFAKWRSPPKESPAVDKQDIAQSQRWPLLLDATLGDPPDVNVFRCLLDRGADFNLVFHKKGATVWVEIVATALVAAFVEGRWDQWVPILRLFIAHGAKVDRHVVDLAFSRLHRAPSGWMEKERAFVILDCVVNGMDDLALEYLRGENDVTTYEKTKKQYHKTQRHSPTLPGAPLDSPLDLARSDGLVI